MKNQGTGYRGRGTERKTATTKSKTFDTEELRQQRIGGNNFNTEEPEKKRTEEPEAA